MLRYPIRISKPILSLREFSHYYSSTFPASSYLETSSLPTHYFQPYLPQLPIPSLSTSCGNYLTAVRPLLDSRQYTHIQILINQLQSSGHGLQNKLVARNKQNRHTSYITGPWTDRYLRDRSSIVLTHNAFIGFKPDPHNMDPLERATKMISIAAKFKASLLDNQLKPMIFHMNPRKSETESYARAMKLLPGMLKIYTSYLYYKAFPLDMVQFSNLFNSTRIPMPDKDELSAQTSARHISVVHNGNFYTFNVFREDGTILSPDEIYQHLTHITKLNSPTPTHPVSILTAADRDTWTVARKELTQNEQNAVSLKSIDESLFLLCLDTHESSDVADLTKAMLHGDGINRWFDKCFQIIIQPQGHCGLHFEHSWGDGVAVMRLFDALYEHSVRESFKPQNGGNKETNVQKVNFKLSDNVKQTIERVREEFKIRTDKLKVKELQFKRGGRKYFKKMDFSPDASIQLAIQMAYYLLSNGKTAPSYESASTSAFKHGRTETVRPCTEETLECSREILSGKLPTKQLIEKIASCSKKHSSLVKQGVMGKSFDRHFFGLSSLAKKLGMDIPELFTDPLHQYVNHFVISTSTLSSDSFLFGGFAPVVDDGFGIGYAVRDEEIGANVSTYETRDSKEFVDALNVSINKIFDILDKKH